jgi:hypothetical protein
MSVQIVIDRPLARSDWDNDFAPTRSITASLTGTKKPDYRVTAFLIAFVVVMVVALGFGVWYTWVFLDDWFATGGKEYTNGRFMYCCTLGIFIPLAAILITAYFYYLCKKKADSHVDVQAKE